MQLAVYPGSFDPITRGHLDIIERSSRLCERLIVAVVQNPKKQTLFSLTERQEIIRECLPAGTNIEVDFFQGLLVNYLTTVGASCVIKGLRNGSDFESELQMARLNAGLAPGVETIFLPASPEVGHFSSTMVREIAVLRGDVASMVLPAVVRRLQSKLQPGIQEDK